MVTQAKLKKPKIDIVDELHKVRKENSHASSEEIEREANEVLKQIKKRKQLKPSKQEPFLKSSS